jgi:hypothetical protein
VAPGVDEGEAGGTTTAGGEDETDLPTAANGVPVTSGATALPDSMAPGPTAGPGPVPTGVPVGDGVGQAVRLAGAPASTGTEVGRIPQPTAAAPIIATTAASR